MRCLVTPCRFLIHLPRQLPLCRRISILSIGFLYISKRSSHLSQLIQFSLSLSLSFLASEFPLTFSFHSVISIKFSGFFISDCQFNVTFPCGLCDSKSIVSLIFLPLIRITSLRMCCGSQTATALCSASPSHPTKVSVYVNGRGREREKEREFELCANARDAELLLF